VDPTEIVQDRAVTAVKLWWNRWRSVASGVVVLVWCMEQCRTGDTSSHAFTWANTGLLIATPVFAVLLGELIVAGVARILGDRVVAIVIGLGPVIVNGHIGALWLRLHAAPVAGTSVITTTRERGQASRIVVARVISALALGLIGFAILHSFTFDGLRKALETRWAFDITFGFAVCMVGFFGVASIFGIKAEHRKSWLCLGIAQVAAEAAQRGAYADAIAQARAGLARHPDDVVLQMTLAQAFGWSANDEALAILEKLRARADLHADYRPLVDNNFAWQCYMNQRHDLLRNADLASQFSLSHAPTDASRLDTRGHILLWSKRYAEAEQMLVKAYAGRTRPDRTGRASSAVGMALLCAATDRPGEAQTWLERARAEGVTNDLIARATAAVEPLSRR